MGSRIRLNPDKIFDCFLEIVAPQNSDEVIAVPPKRNVPWVLQKFPDSFTEEEVLKLVPHFCYPCKITTNVVQVFSFVLTSADSKWTFGYCRHTPDSPTAICLLSSLPWHETFYELLNRIIEITHRKEAGDLRLFLEALYNAEVPEPGSVLFLSYEDGKNEYTFPCSDHTILPSIPENRNLSEYFNAIDSQNMMILFASMLNERRIIITSQKLSRLSACVQAANALIYPMSWQHIFIPILPLHLIDYISAPMPFLIGVQSSLLEKVRKSDLGEVVVMYADQNKVETPFDDLHSLPPEIVSSLKRRLKNSNAMLGDKIARVFLYCLVQLIGGYRDALKLKPGEKITFNSEAFIQTRSPSMQPFLEKMLHLQIFQQFIEERLDMLNSGEGFSDDFELEVNVYADKTSAKLRNQYKEWMINMKKEGGALLKSVKNKANPAMKHAYKSVKDKSKKAYKEMRSKFQDLQPKDANIVDGHPVGHLSNLKSRHPRSAPSSPTLNMRARPVTFHGIKNSSKIKSTSSIQSPASSVLSQSKDDSFFAKSRQYNLLEVAEVVEEPKSVEDDQSSDSSPSLTFRRISMDLMGDLQDIIFRRCSISDSSVADASLKDTAIDLESVSAKSLPPEFQSTSTISDNNLPQGGVPEFTPIPPPRTKRRGAGSTHNKCHNQSPSSQAKASPQADRPLIELDAEEKEETFDPLLAKPMEAGDNLENQTTSVNGLAMSYQTTTSFSQPSVNQNFLPFTPQPYQLLNTQTQSVMASSLPSFPPVNTQFDTAASQQQTFQPVNILQPPNFQNVSLPNSSLHRASSSSPYSPSVQLRQKQFTTFHPTAPTAVNVTSNPFSLNPFHSPVSSSNVASDNSLVRISNNPFIVRDKQTEKETQPRPIARPKVPPPPTPISQSQPNQIADPFSELIQWDGTSQKVTNKAQWETFN